MYRTLECLALRSTRISDSKSLLSAWSRQLGRVTFAFPAGNSREARRRRALCPPLAAFEGVCDVKPGRDILSLRDIRPCPSSLAVGLSPVKGFVAIFLAEVLDILLRRSEPDDTLSDFLFTSAEALDAMSQPAAIANFHLIFLYRLAHLAGVGPDLEGWHRKAYFDMRDSIFRNTPPLHHDYLCGRECTALMALSRAGYRSAAHLPFNRESRRRALDSILRYFELHLTPLSSLKSLEILRSMAE